MTKDWNQVKLKDICKTTSGGTPSRSIASYYNGDIPWVKSGELNDGPVTQTEEHITETAISNSSAKVFPSGTLLIRLRRLRRTARELSDTYLQSVFLEMFGDPVSNPMVWECEAIKHLCDKIIDYRGRTPPYSDSGIPHITDSCIKDSRIDWTQCKYVSEETYAAYMTRGLPEFNDVIFTTEAPMGETAVVDTRERFSLAQRLVLLRTARSRMEPHCLSMLLSHRSFFPRLKQFVTGSTVFGIRSVHLISIRIPVPPLALQQQLAHVAEHLFQTLLQRAFQGQLSIKDHERIYYDSHS